MGLPYKKVEAFEFDKTLYPTEALALQAAIQKIIGNPGVTTQVMRDACRLAPLVARACEMGPAAPESSEPATG
jgi:hypothetical protein